MAGTGGALCEGERVMGMCFLKNMNATAVFVVKRWMDNDVRMRCQLLWSGRVWCSHAGNSYVVAVV